LQRLSYRCSLANRNQCNHWRCPGKPGVRLKLDRCRHCISRGRVVQAPRRYWGQIRINGASSDRVGTEIPHSITCQAPMNSQCKQYRETTKCLLSRPQESVVLCTLDDQMKRVIARGMSRLGSQHLLGFKGPAGFARLPFANCRPFQSSAQACAVVPYHLADIGEGRVKTMDPAGASYGEAELREQVSQNAR